MMLRDESSCEPAKLIPPDEASIAAFNRLHVDRLKTPAWIFDIDLGRVHWANKAGLGVWNAETIEELSSRDMKADMSASVRRRLSQYQEDFRRGDPSFSELWTIYPDGKPQTLRVLYTGITLPDGRTAMFCEALAEATEQPETLRSAEALLHTQLMISLYSNEGLALYSNPAARAAMGTGSPDLKARFAEVRDYDDVIANLPREGEIRRVVRMRTSKGIRWHELTARNCLDAVTGAPACLISEVDVSDLKEAENKANFLAYHDVLTGLPNRSSATRTFQASLQLAQARNLQLGVLFLDLDNFKFINDSLGHAFGDDVLIEVAHRLSSMPGESVHVVRLGGDEFLLFVAEPNQAAVESAAEHLIEQFSTPFFIGGRKLDISHSIGVSLYPDHGTELTDLMKSADLAMYKAKEAGRNCYRVFSETMKSDAEKRLELASSIQSALSRGEFEVYYQPRVSASNLLIVGAEALVRWNHPTRGLISPLDFIPLCEESGLIERLGEFVLRTATQQQKRWSDEGRNIAISVNVSPRQVRSASMLDIVRNALRESGCAPENIEIELTESMLMERDDGSRATIEALHDLGMRISVDDFGTGYSNLARLREFSIDCVKIDRTFIHDLAAKKPLTEIIIHLCKLMNMKIVAEGVETIEQVSWLRSRKCEELQGYYFSRPVPAIDFEGLLFTQKTPVAKTSIYA